MSFAIALARPPAAVGTANPSTSPLAPFGIPIVSDEAGGSVAASNKYGALAVSLWGAGGAAVSSSSPMPVSVISGVSDKTATGTITTTTPTNVALTGGGLGATSVVITGTWTGTLSFQVSGDGTNWTAVQASPPGGGPDVTSTTGNGQWVIPAAGYNGVRVLGPTSTGSATVNLESTLGTDAVALTGPLGQQLMAASLPVVIASNQTAIPVTQGGVSGDNADAIAVVTTGESPFLSRLTAFNGTTWDRVRALAPIANAAAAPADTGMLATVLFGSDGTHYRNPIVTTPQGDAVTTAINMMGAFAANYIYNGTSLDRQRSAAAAGGTGAGNTGITAAGILGSDGTNLRAVAVNSSGSVVTAQQALAANILDGYSTFTSTTGATTLITVPAGRTWIGEIGASTTIEQTAAIVGIGSARAVFTTAGTGATPAAGTVAACEAKCGSNAATGTVGTSGANSMRNRLVVIAPGGNTVTVQVTATVSGTSGTVDAWAIGELQ